MGGGICYLSVRGRERGGRSFEDASLSVEDFLSGVSGVRWIMRLLKVPGG